jgi:RimJ/RimL family protein N-acetyltransferase/ubiquinone/menaquinone biosynthesis C-methylase UbiE
MPITLPIETERQILRDFVAEDFDALHAITSDPEVMRFMFHGARTAERQRAMLDEVIVSQREAPRRRYELAVVRRADGRLLGSVDLTPDEPGVADLGYLLGREAWGQGYATEAARTMVAAGFDQLGLHRIFATCDVNHTASARVLEKAGLRRDGVLRGHTFASGRWWDSYLYAVLEDEWRTRGDELPRLYTELAPWFHLLTAPEDYAEEAEFYRQAFISASATPPRTLLELGSGGGNMASHYKRHFQATLVDRSEDMLAISRGINPELEHIQGDMRDVRLGRQFDAVFVHDAVVYMTTLDDLRRAIETAYVHTRPGGVAVFAPDHVRENFRPSTRHGGHDGDGRALRYLEWSTDPDPADNTYTAEYAYLLHEQGRPPRMEYDRHVEGLFSRAEWLRLLTEAGFRPESRPLLLSDLPPDFSDIFVAVRT